MPRPPRTSTANLSANSAAATTGPDNRPPLPSGWKWATLGEVCELRTGTRDHGQSPDAPFLYVDISSVDNKRKRITEAKRLLGKVAPSRARQVIKTGDVLVATTRPNLNAVALVPPEFNDQIASTGFCVLRNTVEVLPEFLFSFVQTPAFVEALSDLVKGALYPAVTDKQVQGQPIPLPPLAEQRRIVAGLRERLDAVERARAATAAQLADANALPAACLRELFTSPEAQQWPVKRLDAVGEIAAGITLGKKRTGTETLRSIPYLRVANVKDGRLDLSNVYNVEATPAEIAKCLLRPGDILLTEGGDPDKLGRGTFWQGQIPECIHQNHIFRVRFDQEHFSPEFLSWQFGSIYGKTYFLKHAKQTTGIASINQQVLSAFPLLVPPLATQRRIAAELKGKLAGAEALRSSLAAQLADLDALPTAYLRQAFAGEF